MLKAIKGQKTMTAKDRAFSLKTSMANETIKKILEANPEAKREILNRFNTFAEYRNFLEIVKATHKRGLI